MPDVEDIWDDEEDIELLTKALLRDMRDGFYGRNINKEKKEDNGK
jgi:hypothetical protein